MSWNGLPDSQDLELKNNFLKTAQTMQCLFWGQKGAFLYQISESKKVRYICGEKNEKKKKKEKKKRKKKKKDGRRTLSKYDLPSRLGVRHNDSKRCLSVQI